MKIYQDPELPDVKVEWFDGDCANAGGNVVIILDGQDDLTARYQATVPCTDLTTTFKDLPRQRFHVAGTLYDTDGAFYGMSETDVDLRNSFDATVSLYFGGFDNFLASWAFDMGATCASVQADDVMIVLTDQNNQPFSSAEAPCQVGQVSGNAPAGMYTVSGYALRFSDQSVVAASQPFGPFMIAPGSRVDLGTITLSPCGSMCPDPFGP